MADITECFAIPTPSHTSLAVAISQHAVECIRFISNTPAKQAETVLGKKIEAVLREYLRNPLTPLDLPLAPAPTCFQTEVRTALCAIPPGETRQYGELARQLNTSARAIGQACRANPVPVIVPCHRVVAVGDLGGFVGETRGDMARLKAWLLQHESRQPC